MNDNLIILRDAKRPDLPHILQILNNEIIHGTAIYHYESKSLKDLEDWFETKKSAKMPLLVAVCADEILGYGTFDLFHPYKGYQFSVEHSVYVKTTQRGKGVGKAILEYLLASAKSKNYHTMIGLIDSKNQKSLGFHQNSGFFESGRLKQVGFKFGQWLDVIYMQKIL